jgi:mannose-6-phosphate isomerase-like protein (cupin superfamily)
LSDYTVKRIEDMEAYYGGVFRKARAELGVWSFGLSIVELGANAENYPEHDHVGARQEEVYVVLHGTGEMDLDGETIALDPETVVRVGPTVKRRIRPGAEGMRLVAIGGVAREVYEHPPYTELGSRDPLAEQRI